MSTGFNKSYTTPIGIVQLLRERGLEIADESKLDTTSNTSATID